MPDTLPPQHTPAPGHHAHPDTLRAELLRAAVAALARTAPALPDAAARFIAPLHAALPTPELAAQSPESLAAATASLWSLAAHRRPGEALVRVTAPQGASGGRGVAEIVTDDMPFLVDSALAALGARTGGAPRVVRQLLHPVAAIRRDASSALLDWSATPAPDSGGWTTESWMRIEFTGPGDAALDMALRRAMADVRAANADFAAMRALAVQAATEVAARHQPDGRTAAEFLHWLLDDNFVLLGHRRVAVTGPNTLSVIESENLGLLRDPRVAAFDTLTDLQSAPPALRTALLEPVPLAVAKANLRSTVHRAAYGDVVVTRIFAPDEPADRPVDGPVDGPASGTAAGRTTGRTNGQASEPANRTVTGVRIFFGLFAATAYTRNPRSIPLLAQKVASILDSSGVAPESHDGRALRHVMDTWPRDELFQAPEPAILAGAQRALDLRLRPRTALVLRLDPFERFVSAIVWLPRDVFDTRLRERVGGILARAYNGQISAFYIALGDEPLARVNYIIGTTPGAVPPVDATVLQDVVRQAARDFRDRLAEALSDRDGEAAAARLSARWGDAFPAAYQEAASAAQAAADLALAERATATGRPATRLQQSPGTAPDLLTLRLAQPGLPMPLSDTLPLLESLDLRAIEEVPYRLRPTRPDITGPDITGLDATGLDATGPGAPKANAPATNAPATNVPAANAATALATVANPPPPGASTSGSAPGPTDDAPVVVLQLITLRAGTPVDPARFPALLEALDALLDGRTEADGFNRLVLRAGLTWRECWLLRAMYRWLKQVGFAFSQAGVETALATHPGAARILVDLFHARFAPDRIGPDKAASEAAFETALDAAWATLLDGVANPDEDRILSRLMTLLRAVLRTNFHAGASYIALKISSADAGDMPAPRPWREIFVHSARMEGCHLRAGPVARGGIRWSDRREDFRTEILGLMKAQRLKNVVIVPTGAKGGFVLKQAPIASNRDAFMAEGIACYSILINAMLDMADDLHGLDVATPPGIRRRDGDDPYMVAAADKGTATFSDIANGIATSRGFWLGDAFASGGSQGYDHKAMGITARGAWVMVARHFAELGLDIQTDPFTCVGVGDMSGDVFGNGLLVSRQTRLLAAFDHRHIFLDPDPDAEHSYAERARLFTLPRSSWLDYDPTLISPGGGVFARSEKRITLPPASAALLGLPPGAHEPAAIMQAILRAPVDLLYFGGIGTYVKATAESQADAGDRASDALRVNGADLRARVLAEGANLAITQAGRIEYARTGASGTGGRLNTDALDNSAGVSTSDREVNIKILLADAEREGALTRRQRDDLLASMTEEVGTGVLRDNHQQSLAVSLEVLAGPADLPAQSALMLLLERQGLLDRALSGLPDAATLKSRTTTGDALLRPEVAALLPVAKLWLTGALDDADPDPTADPAFTPTLLTYFPHPLQHGFARFATRHRLRRELVATVVANGVANRLGPAALGRLAADGPPLSILRAAWLASELFGLDALCDAIDAAPAPAATRLDALLTLRRLQEAVTRDLLAAGLDGPLDAAIAALRPGIAALTTAAATEAANTPAAATLRAAGLPDALAAQIAAAPSLAAAPAIVRLASQAGVPPAAVGTAWSAVGRSLGIEDLRAAIAQAPAPGPFGPRAKAALLSDLLQAQSRAAAAAVRGTDPTTHPGAAAATQLARDAAAAPDLAGLSVAVRAVAGVV